MSKIRLHGSSSGYTEIAPVAASGNNTITLPNDGTIISKDANGAVGVTSITVGTGVTIGDGKITCDGSALTSINAAQLVGVCTSGLTKTGGFGKVLKVQQSLINSGSISSFAAASTTYQTMSEDTFVVAGTNTNLLVILNIAGHMSASNADRNFRLAYKVASGSYTNFGFNSNGTVSENIGSDFRGDDIQHGMNISFSFLIDGTWNAGDTITIKLETVGEGTFYHNGAISAADVRFGNGLSKIILTEYSD